MTQDYSEPLQELRFQVDDKSAGLRLDTGLAAILPHRSRNFFQLRIHEGGVSVNGRPGKSGQRLHKGDEIVMKIHVSPSWVDPLSIPLEVLAHREDLIVLNKKPGQVVHPTGALQGGTLLNALHARHKANGGAMENLPRVIHRLDAETSGVIIFALGSGSAAHYGQLFETRRCQKTYLALLEGELSSPIECHEPLGDDVSHEVHVRQAVRADGKPAFSVFHPLSCGNGVTLARVALHSGRLHQIRVHAAHLGIPILGDPLYNPADEDFGCWLEHRERRPHPNRPLRQLLHAWRLSVNAANGNELLFEAPVPEDFSPWLPSLPSWHLQELLRQIE